MPPPPCELSVIVRPSTLDGLHQKLLVNRLSLGVWLLGQYVFLLLFEKSVVPSGKPASKVASNGLDGKFTPLESTVIAAPSSAPIKLGSCSNSAKLPLRLACQPTVASSGKRSTCGLLVVEWKPNQPDPQLESKSLGEPSGPRPNRQSTRARQSFSLP